MEEFKKLDLGTITQVDLEDYALKEGIRRYREALKEGGEATLPPGQKLLRKAILPVALAVEASIAAAERGEAGRAAGSWKYVAQWDSDVVAFVAVRACIQSLNAGTSSLQSVAIGIAQQLEDQEDHEMLKRDAPALYRQLLKRITKYGTSGKQKHIVLKRQMKFSKVESVAWDRTIKTTLGIRLVELVAENTKLVSIARIPGAPLRVVPGEGVMEWLEQSHARCELLAPVRLPMVEPPKDWTGLTGGGYYRLRSYAIRVRNSNTRSELRKLDLTNVYSALNALQSTRWRVNREVLSVLREAYERGLPVVKLPSKDRLPLPEKYFDLDNPNPEELREWKAKAARIYSANARGVSKRIHLLHQLWVAESLASREALWFPHYCDFRGRMYSMTAYLSPQGDDVAKGLLRFSDMEPLGEDGCYWLAVSIANHYGVDKVAFDDRAQWVSDNYDMLLDIAEDPLGTVDLWGKADKPWQFLAGCFEWSRLNDWVEADNPQETFQSYLPVSWDGSCNGLQHYSMALRDPVGGAAVNLVPSEKPSDVYSLVAARAEEINAASSDPLASAWAGKITRPIAKRPCMTLPYGATRHGFVEQLRDTFEKLKDETCEYPLGLRDDESDFPHRMYMGAVLWQAIGDVVVAARSTMDWLRAAADLIAKDGLPIRWVAPSGFHVVQDYREPTGKRINTQFQGQRLQVQLTVEGTRIDKRRMMNAIAPNVVHSLDAAHLVATVNRMRDVYGVAAFAMVHDSYGTHAGSAGLLHRVLREEFVKMYEGDFFAALHAEWSSQLRPELAAKLPPPPTLGTLDPQAVLRSEYFFA